MPAAEPIFIRQWRVDENEIDQPNAIYSRADEARAAGATFMRMSVHPEDPLLLLLEGWVNPPYGDDGCIDQGEPRWMKGTDNGRGN